MTAAPEQDPLQTYESMPAVSFAEANGGYAKGVWAKLAVRDWPKLLEQKDDDGVVERWDNGDAKLVLVVPVHDGEENGKPVEKNLWAKKFGKKAQNSIFQQLAKAQKKVREDLSDPLWRLGPGDVLAVKYVDDDRSVPPKKGNYPKMYAVTIRPGQRPAPTKADPLADSSDGSDGTDPWADTGNDSSSEPRPGGSAPQDNGAPPANDPFGAADPSDGDEPPF